MCKQLSVNENWEKRGYVCVACSERGKKKKKSQKEKKGEEWTDMAVHSSIIPLQSVAAVKRNH